MIAKKKCFLKNSHVYLFLRSCVYIGRYSAPFKYLFLFKSSIILCFCLCLNHILAYLFKREKERNGKKTKRKQSKKGMSKCCEHFSISVGKMFIYIVCFLFLPIEEVFE